MSIRKESKARTRAAIVDAATTEFAERGYEAATIRSIAKRAGLSTGAVFSSFTGKPELYAAVYGHEPVTPEEGRALRAEVEALRRQVQPIAAE